MQIRFTLILSNYYLVYLNATNMCILVYTVM